MPVYIARGNLGAFTAAQKPTPVRERSASVAKEDLTAQQARFAKGLISKLAVLQAQVALESAQLALSQAQHRLALSVVELAASATLDLWAKCPRASTERPK